VKIERILTGIDFGTATESIIGYSSFFAKFMDASLKLLYVIDYLVTPPAYLAPYMEKEKKVAEKRFALLKKRMKDTGIKVETEVAVGRLHESFDSAAKKLNADMLVLGFMSHALRRSSSEKLIKGLQMPMLVVRGEKAESARIGSVKIRRILCPTDFSEASGKALKAANELKSIFSAELDVIYILPDYILKRKIEKLKDMDKIIQKLFEDTRENLKEILSDYDIEKTGMIDEGEPDKRIVSFSKENDIDLIVMGARGLGFIKGIFIGSITDAVLKSSPCPVLIIH
jgi:nucleotide-binding universal stress UspA family protein